MKRQENEKKTETVSQPAAAFELDEDTLDKVAGGSLGMPHGDRDGTSFTPSFKNRNR